MKITRFITVNLCLLLASGSDILVSLKGTSPKCFGEELASNELLVLKADVQSPTGTLINVYVFSGLAEVGEINTKKVEKKNIVYHDSRKSQIATAFTSASVIILFHVTHFSGKPALDMCREL